MCCCKEEDKPNQLTNNSKCSTSTNILEIYFNSCNVILRTISEMVNITITYHALSTKMQQPAATPKTLKSKTSW